MKEQIYLLASIAIYVYMLVRDSENDLATNAASRLSGDPLPTPVKIIYDHDAAGVFLQFTLGVIAFYFAYNILKSLRELIIEVQKTNMQIILMNKRSGKNKNRD